MKKMYTLEEAFSLVGSKGEAIKAEVRKSHSYLPVSDIETIEFAIDMSTGDSPTSAARFFQLEDTIVREAAVESIVKVTGSVEVKNPTVKDVRYALFQIAVREQDCEITKEEFCLLWDRLSEESK